MDRCWLRDATGDALHAVLCAAGYNMRWLLRAIVRLGFEGLLAPPFALLIMLTQSFAMAAGARSTGISRTAAVAG